MSESEPDIVTEFAIRGRGRGRGGERGNSRGTRRGSSRRTQAKSAQSREVLISKACAYILRHGAEKEGLNMRRDGYVRVGDLLNRPKLVNLKCDLETLKQVVDTNEKQRFSLINEPDIANPSIIMAEGESSVAGGTIEGTWWIRANQGHSISNVNPSLEEITSAAEIPLAVHGTNMRAWQSIKSEGLSRMGRQHIHMATGLNTDTSVISGMRATSTVFILIDIEQALSSEILFYRSSNGVVLSPGNAEGYLPPITFRKVIGRFGETFKRWEGDGWGTEVSKENLVL